MKLTSAEYKDPVTELDSPKDSIASVEERNDHDCIGAGECPIEAYDLEDCCEEDQH